MSEINTRKDKVSIEDMTQDQVNAYELCKKFIDDNLNGTSTGKQYLTITGYAGTGKTTVLAYVESYISSLERIPVVLSYTGKAVSVLRSKGIDSASTIHSTIYTYKWNSAEGKLESFLGEDLDGDFILLDEYSMVDDELFNDIMMMNKPVIIFGDDFQLPPPGGDQKYKKSDYTLTEVVRQSGIIVQYASEVRLNGYLSVMMPGVYTNEFSDERITLTSYSQLMNVIAESGLSPTDFQFLCFTNKTRHQYNKFLRDNYIHKGPLPVNNDKLIATSNDWKANIINGYTYTAMADAELIDINDYEVARCKVVGSLGDVREVDLDYYRLVHPEDPLIFEDRPKSVRDFDYAYCMTVHKSQGSEWDNIVILDDYNYGLKIKDMNNYNRWLYTAITRGRKNIILVR